MKNVKNVGGCCSEVLREEQFSTDVEEVELGERLDAAAEDEARPEEGDRDTVEVVSKGIEEATGRVEGVGEELACKPTSRW